MVYVETGFRKRELVDGVEEIVPGESITAYKNVTFNDDFLRGHFPGNPIMPGVTIVEAMAQTTAVMVGASLGLTDGNLLVYFMAIDA